VTGIYYYFSTDIREPQKKSLGAVFEANQERGSDKQKKAKPLQRYCRSLAAEITC